MPCAFCRPNDAIGRTGNSWRTFLTRWRRRFWWSWPRHLKQIWFEQKSHVAARRCPALSADRTTRLVALETRGEPSLLGGVADFGGAGRGTFLPRAPGGHVANRSRPAHRGAGRRPALRHPDVAAAIALSTARLVQNSCHLLFSGARHRFRLPCARASRAAASLDR